VPTVYSPPVSTYVPLATITLSSTDSEIVFSSIPATYRDLVLVYRGVAFENAVSARANADTGTNYSLVRMGGNGSTTFSSAPTTSFFPILYSGTPVTGMGRLMIFDYSATDKHKTALTRGDGSDYSITEALASRWANTDAIHSLTVYTGLGVNFAIGSTFSLYGIAA